MAFSRFRLGDLRRRPSPDDRAAAVDPLAGESDEFNGAAPDKFQRRYPDSAREGPAPAPPPSPAPPAQSPETSAP